MKKSMFALFGCALVAGSVMAAEVTGNNTAVVIQKAPVVSNNLYQFLIVPVKGFDITGNPESNKSIALQEILPPTIYPDDTMVYSVKNPTQQYIVKGGKWERVTSANAIADAENQNVGATVTFAPKEVLWLQSPDTGEDTIKEVIEKIPATVFCGQLASDTFEVTPDGELITPFGNATSTPKTLANLDVTNGKAWGDTIYVLASGSAEYERYFYDGNKWTTKGTSGGIGNNADASGVVIPPGGAAYYKRR